MYVILTWWDGSKKVLETLPNDLLFEKYGIEVKEDEVYDLLYKRKVYVPEGVNITYSDKYPQIEGVDLDANRFI